jgi:DNA-binding IclR family transcriptional regulator
VNVRADPNTDKVVSIGGARPEYKAPAADKALDILEFMSGRPEGVTQTEISLGIGRSIHEIYRIIQLLEKRGYLFKTPEDRYRLSLKLFELAHQHPPVNRLIDSALPVMRRLVADTDQSCHLVVLSNLHVLILLQVDSLLPMRYSVALGSQFPILETSSGAVLLAAMPKADRETMVDQLIEIGESEERRSQILARLDRAAELDYEMRPSLAVEGCTNISTLVRDHRSEVVAALTVPYLKQKHIRFDRISVLASTRAAALEISRALGASDQLEPRTRARNIPKGWSSTGRKK